jgi:hypothetical protein
MSATPQSTAQHPAPKTGAMRLTESFFVVFAGPIMWFLQLTVGFALVTEPCFNAGEPAAVPALVDRTHAAALGLVVLAWAVSLVAAWVAWRAYQRTEDEGHGDHRHVVEVGAGRTRFLALWGVILGIGSAVATSFTAVALIVLPRCGG